MQKIVKRIFFTGGTAWDITIAQRLLALLERRIRDKGPRAVQSVASVYIEAVSVTCNAKNNLHGEIKYERLPQRRKTSREKSYFGRGELGSFPGV